MSLLRHAHQPRTLDWVKCTGDQWCPLSTLNLEHPHFNGLRGVYIIWHGGKQPRVLYVGQGNIADRLREHRSDNQFLLYFPHGLFATWASIDENSMDGVESFLISKSRPLISTQAPTTGIISVNFPW